ncbi:MAG: TorF family putative porin [Brevundimonas sp.]
MKTVIASVCSAAVLALAGAASAQDFSFNVTATSDYVWRGVSQSDEDFAIQGGVDYASGIFYAGTWASSVDFGDDTDAEIDFYLGVAPSAGGFDWNLGVTHYMYAGDPDGSDYDFTEASAAVSRAVGPATWGLKLAYSPDFFGAEDDATYLEANFAVEPASQWSVSGAVGQQWVDSGADYLGWNLGVGYAFNDTFGLDLRYHDTSEHDWGDIFESRVIVSLTAGF